MITNIIYWYSHERADDLADTTLESLPLLFFAFLKKKFNHASKLKFEHKVKR